MEILRELGLSKYESAIYDALLRHGRSSADKISERSRVPITAVYPNLKSLVSKKLVQQILGDVSLFEAFPAEAALSYYVKRKEEDLEKLKKSAIEYSKSLIKPSQTENRDVVWLTHGKQFSNEAYLKAFSKARKTFYIIGWRFEKIGNKYSILKELKKLVKRKIDVRIILTGALEKKWDLARDYAAEGIKVRYLPLNNFSIFIRDSEECKITLKDQDLPDRFNIHVADVSLARAMSSYFLEQWREARDLDYFPGK
ncbi:MAG: hypothetical protein KKB21_01725 [Nanoarchaeota archaeon]|nr:hypothetical protein [Nanoarchaeota archaeon]MBU4086276.1 hypothetical protein [Nanoarchaeota archaeon]